MNAAVDVRVTGPLQPPPQPRRPNHPGCGRLDTAPRWAVVRTHPQAERWADSNLARIGYRTYLPLVLVRRRDPVLRTLTRHVEAPLFPSYLFVLHSPADPWTPIRYAAGIASLLVDNGGLAYTRTGEIEALIDTEADRRMPPADTQIRPGSACVVARGPCSGADGVVLDVAGTRARVSLLMLGALRSVTLPVAHLEQRDAA